MEAAPGHLDHEPTGAWKQMIFEVNDVKKWN